MKINFKKILSIFGLNQSLRKKIYVSITIFQISLFLLIWILFPVEILPKPMELINEFPNLVDKNLFGELLTSTILCWKSMFYAFIVSLLVSYLSISSFFKPISFLFTKLRFLSTVGLTLLFTLLFGGGQSLQISLMVFSVSVYFSTSMLTILKSTTANELNHARTLRMKEWQVVWEVQFLGKFNEIFSVIGANIAMTWLILVFVEKLVESQGGIGKMLYNENKYYNLPAVYLIQFIIVGWGIAQDYLLNLIRNILCPYVKLSQKQSR